MVAPQIDYGQSETTAFANAVSAGTLHFDENSTRQAKQLYDNLIVGLTKVRENLNGLEAFEGFGGFVSAQELQHGFSSKATDGISVISQLIDGAQQLQEAYLRAGGLITEADQVNARRLKAKQQELPNQSHG